MYQLPHRDWRGFSYKPLFKSLADTLGNDYFYQRGFVYDPTSLDDPDMTHGKHRYVLQRSALTGPILSSILLYVNEDELKDTLNAQFHTKHPHMPSSLTLSKIRSLKRQIVNVGLQIGIELATLAVALISFERLCLKNIVSKSNRKLSMACCVLLAYKFLPTHTNSFQKHLDSLIAFFDAVWFISKKQLFDGEFGVYVSLNFTLHLPYQHVHWMYLRILTMLNTSSRVYLGAGLEEVCREDVRRIEMDREEME
ncbi:hypothetical protein EON64_15340, partial [archaeon]